MICSIREMPAAALAIDRVHQWVYTIQRTGGLPIRKVQFLKKHLWLNVTIGYKNDTPRCVCFENLLYVGDVTNFG